MKSNSAQVLIPINNEESENLHLRKTKPQVDNSRAILEIVVNAAREAKGINIKVLDIRKCSDVANYLVIISARSDRHAQGLSHRVLDDCTKKKFEVLSIEGLEKAQWVLADFGDVVLHVFYEPLRAHYDLESLWMKAESLKV